MPSDRSFQLLEGNGGRRSCSAGAALKAGSVERDEVVSFAQVQPVPAQGSIEIVIGNAVIVIGVQTGL